MEPYTLNIEICSVLGIEQDWAIVGVIRVLELGQLGAAQVRFEAYQNFQSGKPVVPGLAISVEDSRAKDLDILSTPLPKGD